MSREEPSNTAEAIRARRFRKNRKARKEQVRTVRTAPAVETEEVAAPSVPIHETRPSSSGGPERFASIPVIGNAPRSNASEGAAEPTAEATPPPSVESTPIVPPAQADAPPQTPPKPPTTAEEAALFGKLLVGYFQWGVGTLMQKDPRAGQAFGAIVTAIPRGPDKAPISPEQGFAALCEFIRGAGERSAIKYNLRIPYMDELTVAGAIGIATWGLAMKPKDPAKQAKNANANGASQQPNAQQAAQQARAQQAPPQPPPQVDDDAMSVPKPTGEPIDLSGDVA